MKKYVVLILSVLAFTISGCSGSDNDSGAKTDIPAAPTPASSTPPDQTTQAPMQAQAPVTTQTAPGKPPLTGKVIKAMHAGGYSYMQVENQGKQFWVAATMMNVKRNDHVSWSDAAVMKNFTSSSLRRTFEEILFVSAAKVM